MRLLISSTAFIVIRRMTRNLFEDFLLKRLLTEFRRGDLFGRCRYPLRSEKVPQISQIYTDLSWDVFKSRRFRRWRRFFSSSDNTEFRGGDLFGRCRYPLGSDKAIHQRFKKICVNLWDKNNPTKKNLCKSVKSVGQNNPTKKNLRISVKSVGQNNPTKKNLRHLRNLRDQKQQQHISGASHWPAAKYPRKSVSNPISKNAFRFIREIRWKKRGCVINPWHTLFSFIIFIRSYHTWYSQDQLPENRDNL